MQESGIDECLEESNVITSDLGAPNHCPVPVNHCAGVPGESMSQALLFLSPVP